MSKEFLNRKKLRYDELIKSNKEKKIIQSDSDSDEDLNNYKNLISGKLNIKSILSDSNKSKNLEIKEKINDKPVQNNNQSLTSKLLNLLPAPNKPLTDKLKFKPNLNLEVDANYRKLLNPDKLNTVNDNLEYDSVNNHDIIDVRVKDQVDSNWEMKFFSKIQKEENRQIGSNIEPTKIDANKNHIRAVVSEYNKIKNQQEDNSSKYSKISTKNKYGW